MSKYITLKNLEESLDITKDYIDAKLINILNEMIEFENSDSQKEQNTLKDYLDNIIRCTCEAEDVSDVVDMTKEIFDMVKK